MVVWDSNRKSFRLLFQDFMARRKILKILSFPSIVRALICGILLSNMSRHQKQLSFMSRKIFCVLVIMSWVMFWLTGIFHECKVGKEFSKLNSDISGMKLIKEIFYRCKWHMQTFFLHMTKSETKHFCFVLCSFSNYFWFVFPKVSNFRDGFSLKNRIIYVASAFVTASYKIICKLKQ